MLAYEAVYLGLKLLNIAQNPLTPPPFEFEALLEGAGAMISLDQKMHFIQLNEARIRDKHSDYQMTPEF